MQKHTSHQVGWKYTVTALALSVAMAPMAQAASVLQSTGKLEITGTPTSRTARTTSMAEAAELIASKTKELAGREYTFQKWLDAKGNVDVIILDEKGNAVSESALPKIAQVILQPELEELLRTRSGRRGLHKVNVALDLGLTVPTERPQTGIVEMSENGETRLEINGRTLSEKDFARLQASEEKTRKAQAVERFAERNAAIEKFAQRHNVELPKDALESSTSTLTLELKAEQIEDLANSNDSLILGIELYQEPTPGGAGAANMADSGIDPWALDYVARGNGIGLYFTDGGCPDEADIDGAYTRLSGSSASHGDEVGDILRDVSPESTMYCRASWSIPTTDDLTTLDPPINVVSRSGSIKGQLTYGTGDRDTDDFVYDEMIPWFNSAGNQGVTDPAGSGVVGLVGGGGQGLNVITVGNYEEWTDAVDTASSFVDPSTGNNKPEIVAPGTATSWATPHAAAFSVDSMSQSTFQKSKPHLVKAKQIAGATDPIAGDATGITMWEIPDKTGAGGIDFLSSHYNGMNYWMHGNNAYFDTLDAADGSADDYITREVHISNTHDAVRIAMSWLTRGTYTYEHRDDAHAIGMDLDLTVYDPAGTLLGLSWSYDNAFEVVDFEPTTSGTYTFKIKRWSNNDTDNKLRLGVAVNWYNE